MQEEEPAGEETEETVAAMIPSLEDETEEQKEKDREMRIRAILQEFLA